MARKGKYPTSAPLPIGWDPGSRAEASAPPPEPGDVEEDEPNFLEELARQPTDQRLLSLETYVFDVHQRQLFDFHMKLRTLSHKLSILAGDFEQPSLKAKRYQMDSLSSPDATPDRKKSPPDGAQAQNGSGASRPREDIDYEDPRLMTQKMLDEHSENIRTMTEKMLEQHTQKISEITQSMLDEQLGSMANDLQRIEQRNIEISGTFFPPRFNGQYPTA